MSTLLNERQRIEKKQSKIIQYQMFSEQKFVILFFYDENDFLRSFSICTKYVDACCSLSRWCNFFSSCPLKLLAFPKNSAVVAQYH